MISPMRESVARNEGREIGQCRNDDQTKREMIITEIRPAIRPVPVVGIALGELRPPTLHQAHDRDDRDADAEREKSAPFAGAGEPKGKTGQSKGDFRPLPAKAVHERGDAEQVEGQRIDIQHRDPRLHEHHLVQEGENGGGKCGALARKQHEAAEIHRDDRKRPEQHARIAPAERPIAENADRPRHELLCQRRVHRIEQRGRRARLEHLLRRGHVMHFVKRDFVGRG